VRVPVKPRRARSRQDHGRHRSIQFSAYGMRSSCQRLAKEKTRQRLAASMAAAPATRLPTPATPTFKPFAKTPARSTRMRSFGQRSNVPRRPRLLLAWLSSPEGSPCSQCRGRPTCLGYKSVGHAFCRNDAARPGLGITRRERQINSADPCPARTEDPANPCGASTSQIPPLIKKIA
jgi:hypothetical protein